MLAALIRLTISKVLILLNSLSKLNQRRWRLKIVGDGDLKQKYKDLSRQLKLELQVEFAGKLDDKELIRSLQNSDLLILPSINSNEAFGIVLIEALACGVPVIASDLPGVRKVFENRQEGLLIEPNNTEDLTRKLKFILNNENVRRNMAKSAQKLVKRKYDRKLIKQKYEDLFSK